MSFEVKDFGSGVKVVFLGHHTNTSPNLQELKELRENEFRDTPDNQLRIWVDDSGKLYFGVGYKS